MAIAAGFGVPDARAATSAAGDRCPTERARTLGSGPGGSLVLTKGKQLSAYGRARTLHLCRPSGKRVRKVRYGQGFQLKVTLVTFTSRHLAFAANTFDLTCAKYEVDVSLCEADRVLAFDMRTGASTARGATSARELALTSNGAVAWVPQEAPNALLGAVGEDQRTLDPGPVDEGSLSVTDTLVEWTRAGIAYSATLE